MERKQRNILYILSLAIMFLISGFLVGCGGKKDTVITSSGDGSVIESQNAEGDKMYTAKADKWNDFLGWYDGDMLYSTDETLAIDGSEPEKLTALFGTNAEHSINRIMQSLFEGLSSQEENNYFNFAAGYNFSIKNAQRDEKYTLQTAGSLALGGDENIIKINLKSQDNIEKMSAIFKNNDEKTLFLVKMGEKEYNYQLPFAFKQFKMPETFSSLEEMFGQEEYANIKEVLDYQNKLSLFENVANSGNQTKMTLRIDMLLDFVKNVVLPNVAESDVWTKEFLETLTKKYQGLGRELPPMAIDLIVDYSASGVRETISDIKGQLHIDEDYKLELGDSVTIPKTNISFDMTSFDFNFAEDATTEGEIDEALEKIEVLNVTIEGQVDFLHEDSATLDKRVIDSYGLTLNTDINPFAIESALSGENLDWEKIDWKNFGYLNLKLSLIEKDGSEAAARHNGATDYINILIDTDKFGANMLVYGALYNPQMSAVTDSHILNNTFYLPKVMEVYGESLAGSFPAPIDVNLNLVVDALKATLSFVINNDSADINDVVYKFLENIMSSSDENVEILKESFYFENKKIFLATDEIKTVINDAMKNFGDWLEYTNFTHNILGSASHLSFDFTKLSYGEVNGATKIADLSNYNEKHKTLVSLAQDAVIDGIDGGTFGADYKTQLDSLKGKEISVSGVLSDGSKAETIDDYKNKNQPIILTIWGYDVTEENDGSVTVQLYLTYAEGTFASTLCSKGIPYGLIMCERQIAVA